MDGTYTYTIREAAAYLARHLKKKSSKQWWGYLKNNPYKWQNQHGIKINCHVINGEIVYTEAALKAFIRLHEPKPQRLERAA